LFVLLSTAAFGKSEHTPKTTDLAAGSAKVSVTVALSQESALKEENIDFSGTVTNETTETVKDFRVTGILPDLYSISKICQSSVSCDPVGANLPAQFVDQIQPGQSIAFWGTVVATRNHPRSRVSFIFRYSTSSGESSTIVYAGNLAVRTGWQNFWTSTYLGLKDLALPIVLAILGLALNFVTNRRDRRLQAQDREKALQAETWNQMLPVSHKLASKFYIHLAGAAWQLVNEWKEYQNLGEDSSIREEKARRTLYFMVSMGLFMKDMKRSIGGFYLKGRVGERIASSSWVGIRRGFPSFQEEPLRAYFRTLNNLSAKDDIDSFLKKIDDETNPAHSSIVATFNYLKALLSDSAKMTQIVNLASLMERILVYETNRIYDYWYITKERLRLEPWHVECAKSPFETDIDKKAVEDYIRTASE